MMRTISVVNPRGGVGKTTVALNLAAALAEGGLSVGLLTWDRMVSRMLCFDPVIQDAYMDRLQPVETGIWQLDVLACREPPDPTAAHLTPMYLREKLATTDLPDWRYLIIDAPPGNWPLASVIAASDELIIPSRANGYALPTADEVIGFLATLREAESELIRPDLEVRALFNEVTRREASWGLVKTLHETAEFEWFHTQIRASSRYGHWFHRSEPYVASVHAPAASRPRVDFSDLAAEILSRNLRRKLGSRLALSVS